MNLKDKVYKIVKERIISGEYAPCQQIVEKDIIDELQISRTPFREAMNALSKEYLVNIYPNRGFFVREYSYKDTLELFDVRYMLEPYVMCAICGKIPEEDIRDLEKQTEEAIEAEDEVRMYAADRCFHRNMLKYLSNSFLRSILENVYENDEVRVRHHHGALMIEGLKEHLGLLQALREGDPDQVRNLELEHLEKGRRRAIESVF